MRRIGFLRHDNDEGATAVMVAILMVPLIGFLAIAIDVGALYAERAQLQNGADAAALAIAQDCADGTCTNDPFDEAALFADANANDGASNVLEPTFPTANSVTVVASTFEASSGSAALTHPFARILGIDSTTVAAEATAEWGALSEGPTVLPLAFSLCEFEAALGAGGELEPDPAVDPPHLLIRYDNDLTCSGRDGHPIPGGFGWLESEEGECGAFVDLDTGTVQHEPGASYPGICDATMRELEGETIYVPIFDDLSAGHGPDATYHIQAFAAFVITGWKLSGGHTFPEVNIDEAAPRCTGECRGIQGFFVRWVAPGSPEMEVGGPDLGATIVRLID